MELFTLNFSGNVYGSALISWKLHCSEKFQVVHLHIYDIDGGGGVVFASGQDMKIFSAEVGDFGKNIVGKRHFQN